MAQEYRNGNFIVEERHFNDILGHVQTGLKVDGHCKGPVTEACLVEFLERHTHILGMVVEDDEVETEARSEIWDAVREDLSNGITFS